MQKNLFNNLLIAISLLVVTLLTTSFGPWMNKKVVANLPPVQKTITVLTLKSPLIYQKRGPDVFGIDYDLLQSFSAHAGYKLKFIVYDAAEDLINDFKAGKGDLVAGRLNLNFFDYWTFSSGPLFEESALDLICRRKDRIDSIADMNNRMILTPRAHMKWLDVNITKSRHAIFWNDSNRSTFAHFQQIQKGKADCAVAEHYEGLAVLRNFPSLEIKFRVSEPVGLSWIQRKDNRELKIAMANWYLENSRNGEIMAITDRYKSHLYELSINDFRTFWKRVRTILPTYKRAFKKAAKKYKLPWQLLAAVSYQESHWNPAAKSFTGVRGFMQLTKDTAKYLGVEDRTDVEQAINGGAKYLRMLFNRTPKHLAYKERLSLALAAWNVGVGHLKDAQGLALKMSRNPHHWSHLQQVLPLLAEETYYSELKHGKARGAEPVQFVRRVRNFYDLLSAHYN